MTWDRAASFDRLWLRYSTVRPHGRLITDMQILQLTLFHWGPYRGRHEINLAVTPEAPVVLFRGENMRGKTSLLRAIVWCLYGRMKLQDGTTPLEVNRLVDGALEDGRADFEVELRLQHQDDVVTLSRTGTASEDESGVVTVERIRATLITEAGRPFAEAAIPEFVEQMLSETISDFYLFDGEMLNRFEERLRADSGSKGIFIEQQVEKALGLPFLGTR